jgi:hypothetical protein
LVSRILIWSSGTVESPEVVGVDAVLVVVDAAVVDVVALVLLSSSSPQAARTSAPAIASATNARDRVTGPS